MNIIDYIPFGKGNAVKREKLCQITGITDRDMRSEIARARKYFVILNHSDGRGYYRPTQEEYEQLRRYRNQEESRLKSIGMGLKPVRKMIRQHEKQERIKESGQISLFDTDNGQVM